MPAKPRNGAERPTAGLLLGPVVASLLAARSLRKLRFPLKHLLFATVLCAAITAPATADVEKVAQLCEQQICFRWWPRVDPPDGWKHEREYSLHYNFNALAPVGSDFGAAETVMYANAVYRPRVPEEKTLSTFISSDLQKFKEDTPGLTVDEAPPMFTGDGRIAKAFLLKPTRQGQWERVAYLEEGEYYIVFVVSSRSERGLLEASQAYQSLVISYREKP
jgi:hypothetical protein